MHEKELLPIRIIDPSRDFSKRNTTGGNTKTKPFLPENMLLKHKEKLIKEVDETKVLIHKNYEKFRIPSLIKAQLHKEALSKSHRPKSVLDKDTCPIVGVRSFGELLLSSTEKGVEKLREKIDESSSKKDLDILSSLQSFSKYDKNDRLFGVSLQKLKEEAKRKDKWVLKLILVDHKDKEINKVIDNNLKDYCTNYNIEVKPLTKFTDFKIWVAILKNFDNINYLLEHPAIKQLSFFPSYRIVKRDFEVLSKTPTIPQHESNKYYPNVAIIDSGISIKNPYIKDWIKDKFPFVLESDSDYNHGTIVAGLAAFGHQLNPEICPEKDCLEVIDIQVLPMDGSGTPLTEDRLITRLEEAIPEIVNKYDTKIFNMSIGFKDKKCEDYRFSSLGIFLDKIQEEYNIIVVLPSGNNEHIDKQRSWPPMNKTNEEKLQVPADSVRSISVGAIACKERADSIVRKGEPTSYSCSGPGPAHIIKPELVHYSGNLSIIDGEADFSKQGIISFNADGEFIEDVGTSYSNPLVTRTISLLNNKIDNPSVNLLKALTIHHSKNPLKNDEGKFAINYIGYGLPSTVDKMIGCNRHEITLIFEKEINPGYHLKCPFHWPESLINDKGKCFGEMKMTLVAKVPLDENYGVEYIRAKLTASLQRMKKDKDGNAKWSREIQEIISTSEAKVLFESDLIEHTFHWKPIKKYYRKITKGIENNEWRFKVELLLRDDVELIEPIPFVLVFTLKDPEGIRPIYDEVIHGLRNKTVNTTPIRLRQKIKQKV